MDADVPGSTSGLVEDGKKILIIGAGCTGLALAHGLKKVIRSNTAEAPVIHCINNPKSFLIADCKSQAGIRCAVYEGRSNINPSRRDWNFALHWSAPALQSLIPGELWARIQTVQVDPHKPTEAIDTLRFHNGKTGELITGIELETFYRLRWSKLQALLSEGLDIYWGKTLVNTAYVEEGQGVKATFKDGTEAMGSMLIGADGSRSTIRSLLVGPDKSKPSPIDFATTVCFASYTRERALFLRAPPHHPLYQVAPHPDGYYSWLGLHDASDPDRPETWVFWHYISYPEPRDLDNKKTLAEHVAHQKAMAALFADPWRSAFEWMPDDTTTAWYGKLNHWDPALPEHAWDSHGGLVTLAGDAAHPMTFQRGQGLNHAVTDSAKLCKAIVDCWNSSEGFLSGRAAAIAGYEKEMIARASEEVRLGEMNSKMLHDWELFQQSPVLRKGVRR